MENIPGIKYFIGIQIWFFYLISSGSSLAGPTTKRNIKALLHDVFLRENPAGENCADRTKLLLS
jgi:hypothetical protein